MSKKRVNEVDSADGVRVGEEPVPGMRLRCICRGHQGPIGRIAWSPCGRFIASPGADRTIRIWDAESGFCITVLNGHNEEVIAVAWAPNGEFLVSESYRIEDRSCQRGEIILWDVTAGKRLHRLDAADELPALGLAWSADGTTIAAGFVSGRTILWNERDGFASITRTLNGHKSHVRTVAWSPNGGILATGSNDHTIRLWKTSTGECVRILHGHQSFVWSLSWIADGSLLASASHDGTVRLWNPHNGKQTHVLEGHTSAVIAVSFSGDGRIAATRGGIIPDQPTDATVRLWRVTEPTELAIILETARKGPRYNTGNLAFHPSQPLLASLGDSDEAIRVWELEIDELLKTAPPQIPVRYTSAKIVLVGESNVGKSCLAMRLAEDRYPDDHEHGTTHGMRFWPMEAEELHPAAKPPDGQRRDVVLWDFGGQDEYRLVHQMFLHDTTLALVLIDPTRGRAAMDEARDWNKRLEKHVRLSPQPSPKGRGRQVVKFLIGTKVDRKSHLIDQKSIDALCEECGFATFVDLSAKTARNIKKVRKLISDALDWDQMAETSRPELFQRVRDDIERRRKSGEVISMLTELQRVFASRKGLGKRVRGGRRGQLASRKGREEVVRTVAAQLAAQGVVVQTRLMAGDEALILQLPVIERYAGSLIIAARNNPRGVPVLEERLLGSAKSIPLPGMTRKERLNPARERMVLECIVELMIQHGICFRHGGLLVFPTLFPAGSADDERLPHSVSLFYDFTGAIDNIYASLVARLMVGEEFGEGRLWSGRVEFDRPGEGICGIRQIKRTGGLAHVDLFFADETSTDRRDLFTRFVEEHLRINGVEIRAPSDQVPMRQSDRRSRRAGQHRGRRKGCDLSAVPNQDAD